MRVHEATGAHIGYINLSGGVGIPYRPEQTENDIMAIGEGVRKKFEEILVPAGMGDVAIFTEMGRFTTGPYGALVQPPSTKSTSTRSTSVWMPAQPT